MARDDIVSKCIIHVAGAARWLLHDASAALRRGGDELFVVGLGSSWVDEAGIDEALSGVPAEAPRDVMMHHPKDVEEVPAGIAPLAIAGHTHGGLIPTELTLFTLVPDEPAG